MNKNDEVNKFLVACRKRIKPKNDFGISPSGRATVRKVTGLRREEVADLAGISLSYYIRIERGNLSGVSAEILNALSSALELSQDEKIYLEELSKQTNLNKNSQSYDDSMYKIEPILTEVLNSISDFPAYIRNECFDILTTNNLGAALHSPVLNSEIAQSNTMRFMFLYKAAKSYFIDWEEVSRNAIVFLHAEYGTNPGIKKLSELIKNLSENSEYFKYLWAKNEISFHRNGVKNFMHPVVGELNLKYQVLKLENNSTDANNVMFIYLPIENTKTGENLELLKKWYLTNEIDSK